MRVFVALALVGCAGAGRQEGASARLNILLIITDQQSATMLSAGGNRNLSTPAMDGLARQGVRFERAYAANPVCAPSRFAMMTGLMPSRIGMESNLDLGNAVPEWIRDQSLGRVFRDAGYEAVYGGKTHLPMTPESIGFTVISRNERDGLVQAFADFFARRRIKPFLAVASFIHPHDICAYAAGAYEGKPPATLELAKALEPPAGATREEFLRKLCPPLPSNFEIPQGEPDGVGEVLRRWPFRVHARRNWTEEQWRLHRWAYARLVETVDGQIGRLVGSLREAGLEPGTLVVLTSDHGDLDSAHRLEHKTFLYEEAARVPLILSWKGRTRPGAVDSHLVSTGLDLLPTLCDYAGIRAPQTLRGLSVRALAQQRVEGWRRSLAVESEHARLLVTERFKYVVYDVGRKREMLVDLERDPGEMGNAADDPSFQGALVAHRRLLKEWYHDHQEILDSRYLVP